MSELLVFWGIAQPRNADGPAFHPLAYHCLDVAACLQEILTRNPLLRVSFARAFGVEGWLAALVFLAALHDIGKFARKFQGKVEGLFPLALGKPPKHPSYNHAEGGYAVLVSAELAPLIESLFKCWKQKDRDALLRAVAFHHGRPLDAAGACRKFLSCEEGVDGPTDESLDPDPFGKAAVAAAIAFAKEAHALTRPFPLPPPVDGTALAWQTAGLVNLADWIGSDQTHFRYRASDLSIKDYWEKCALSRVQNAVTAAGIAPASITRETGLAALTGKETPTPAQRWAETVELPSGPALFVVEDLTGSGKTEAALILAHRLMVAGRAEGLYVALPTMATANAMFGRLAESYRRLFARSATPSLALAHGRSKLHQGFSDSILELGDARELPTLDDDESETASAACAAWIADDRRRAFFAHVGVGTIDQAFLSVLPSKHAALRQLGLARKVLLIDEAHAYDAYMSEEMQRLLEFHASFGGSAIVLSATLPAGLKRKLVRAYTKEAWEPKPAYPLVTVAPHGGKPQDKGKAPRKNFSRRLKVERLARPADALERIIAASRQGAAVAYVRNTVDDAVDAWEALRACGVEAMLFHARFAIGDRLAIERRVLERFGAASKNRTGVLVATQVIEQSLDLDFDVMVTDLAPIDLLIQRAGRLWRHMRSDRPLSEPCLVVLSPDPNGPVVEAHWFTSMFPKATLVYKNHALLWLSAKKLFDAGEIASPEGVRALIEAAYPESVDSAPESVPALLRDSWDHARGREGASRTYANMNLLKFAPAYDAQNALWESDMRAPTREGEDMVLLRFAVRGDALRPLCADEDEWRAWALSEASLRAKSVGPLDLAPEVDAPAKRLEADWARHRIYARCVVLGEPNGDGVRRALLAKTEMTYDPRSGIHVERGSPQLRG